MSKLSDVLWKLRVLVSLLRAAFYDWQRDVWMSDPDQPYCCTPSVHSPCGCGAMTIREIYSPQSSEDAAP
jgi:hypothetical protein